MSNSNEKIKIKDITISAIKINMHTNIPTRPQVTLTYSMLYQPAGKKKEELTSGKNVSKQGSSVVRTEQQGSKSDNMPIMNAYPYFTTDVLYDKVTVMNMDYEERKNFFFNKEKFTEIIHLFFKNTDLNTDYDEDREAFFDDDIGEEDIFEEYEKSKIKTEAEEVEEFLNEYDEDIDEEVFKRKISRLNTKRRIIIDANVSVMLEALFPTSFLTFNNINNSFSENISDEFPTNIYPSHIVPFLTKGFVQMTSAYIPYSYIKLGLSTYTTVRVLWLNDIINHPEYKKLIFEFSKYYENAKGNKDSYDTQNKIKMGLIQVVNRTNKPADFDALIELLQKQVLDRSAYSNTNYYNSALQTFLNDYKKIYAIKEEILAQPPTTPGQSVDIDKQTDEEHMKPIVAFLHTVESLKVNYDKIKDFYKIPNILRVVVLDLYKKTEKIRLLNNIRADVSDIDILHSNDVDKEDQALFDDIKKMYPGYYLFMQTVAKFVRPKLQTTNIMLQKAINDFFEGKNKYLHVIIFKYIKGKFFEAKTTDDIRLELEDEKSEEYLSNNYLYTGISFVGNNIGNRHLYEIEVLFDFIGGELTDANKDNISCNYKSDKMARTFYKLIKKKPGWKVDLKRYFVSLPELNTQNTTNTRRKNTLRKIQSVTNNTRRNVSGIR